MKKFWLLIQETDEHGHHAAYIRPVTSSDNLVSIIKSLPINATVNVYSTKKEPDHICRMMNNEWHRQGVFRWDFMEDGKTPASF